MTVRRLTIAILALAASGCANEQPGQFNAAHWGPAQYLGAGRIQVMSPAVAAESVSRADTPEEPPRKTLGSKVLSAMALERVTGRKPDPSRFAELY